MTLSSADFEYIAKLVKDEAGITLDKGKEYLVQSRVEPVAKSLGFENITSLVSHLQREADRSRRRRVVESLTTHETSFFRDIEPFEALRTKVLPELLDLRASAKELSIWCGAASSGQEPYSLCMLLRESFPELADWRLKFHATDVSGHILEKARTASFNQIEVNRGLPIKLLAKYFEKKGQDWVLKPQVAQMVRFSEFNLLAPFSVLAPADLVMLRNVLIYFDIETKKQILRKVYDLLKPGGYLFLGTAETTLGLCDEFERITFEKTSCYKKRG
ncbi:MAG: protein-glutamate O-methyltransferase CheR [Deltaproteobacteria bacterium]|nr:protein-glutamate O-methyltransferase CheR [Deltaproteobacteria bacterium]